MHGCVFYVGDWDAEGVGDGEGSGPFWRFAGCGVELGAGIDEVFLEAFPSSLVGFAASMIRSNNAF
jgi:hypothetical protein